MKVYLITLSSTMRWKSEAVPPGSSVAKFCSSVSGREPTTCTRRG